METHPRKAKDMSIGSADLSAVVRTIDPILDQLIEGVIKGALYGDDLVDIATRIRSVLHEAVARQRPHDADAASAASAAGDAPVRPEGAASGTASANDAPLVSGAGGCSATAVRA